MQNVHEVIQIVDLDTGEILRHKASSDILTSSGLRNFKYFYDEFLSLVRSGRNIGFNVSCFDSRIKLDSSYDFFVTNKHIDGIF